MQEDNQNNSNNLSVGTYDRGPALKQALVENLTAILSPDHDQRIGGEKNLKFLEATEGSLSNQYLFLLLFPPY